jgi:hypothetical protein
MIAANKNQGTSVLPHPRRAQLALIALACSAAALAQHARGFFGVGLKDAPGGGGEVGVISPGSPAQAAGIRIGDVIVAVGGAPAADSNAVVGALGALAPGEGADLTVVRAGQRLQVHAVLGSQDGGAPGSAAPAAARTAAPVAPLKVTGYESFTEPSEHAFTIEVPRGWAVLGSLMRRGALQLSPFVRTLSPDKMTYLMVGEPTLLTYTPPNATTLRLGWREGSLHNGGLGGTTMLLRYVPGAQFARLYGQTALAGLCPQMHFEGTQERPDFAAAADPLIPTSIPSTATGGEASFTCRHGGADMVVHVDAVTRADRNNIMWNVIFLRALMAPRSVAPAAEQLLEHMTTTFRYDPNWVHLQDEVSRRSADAIRAQVAQAQRDEQAVILKLNATDENFSSIDDIVSGYSTYKDQQTGQTYKLSNTNPGKWVGDGGRIISTPDNNPPPWTPSVRPLTRVD